MKKQMLLLLVSALLLCSCDKDVEEPVEPQVSEEQIKEEQPELTRYNETLSPDGKYLLYNYSAIDTLKTDMGLVVGVDGVEGNNIHKITVGTLFGNDISGLEWLGNGYFAVTVHLNPSTEQYFIYSMESGEEYACYDGYSFTPMKGEEPTVIYAENVPHGFGGEAYHQYAINGNTVYASDVQGGVLSQVAFSEDMTLAVFTESFIYDENTRPSLLVKGYYDGTMIQVLEKIELPDNVSGTPRIEDGKIMVGKSVIENFD